MCEGIQGQEHLTGRELLAQCVKCQQQLANALHLDLHIQMA